MSTAALAKNGLSRLTIQSARSVRLSTFSFHFGSTPSRYFALTFLLVPGMLLARSGPTYRWLGYVWLLSGSVYFFIRCLVDLALVRRPALNPVPKHPHRERLSAFLSGQLTDAERQQYEWLQRRSLEALDAPGCGDRILILSDHRTGSESCAPVATVSTTATDRTVSFAAFHPAPSGRMYIVMATSCTVVFTFAGQDAGIRP